MSVNEELLPLRNKIDGLDSELVRLLNERAEVAKEIGEIKARAGLPVYRPEREAEVLKKICGKNEGPLPNESLVAIWREVMCACRGLESELKVAYLGPRGTFSEQAMIRQFGSGVVGMPSGSIEEVFRKVESGDAAYGIVPIENSTEGAVNRTMDYLLKTSLFIVGECSIPIQHNLMTRSGTMEGITRVYSHPQSLGQCVHWLNRNVPSLERLTAESNGEAARLASENPTYAAVAGEVAAKIFGLQIVAANIQDSSTNRTRFLILGREPAEPSANPREDKTSLIFSVPHRAGSLYQALKPFDDFGVSMMRLDSRPAKRGTWEYFFYTDIEGNMSEPKIREALEIFREGCASLKCLGSYPTEKNFRRADTKGSNL